MENDSRQLVAGHTAQRMAAALLRIEKWLDETPGPVGEDVIEKIWNELQSDGLMTACWDAVGPDFCG